METNSTQAVKADPSVETKPVKRRKRGDTREDGMVFWAYRQGGEIKSEYWVCRSQFAKLQEAQRKTGLQRYLTNPAYLKSWAAANPEKRRQYSKTWRKKHPEKSRRSSREQRRKNPEKRAEINRKWRAANKARLNAKSRNRRSTDPLYLLKGRLGCRVRNAFIAGKFPKNGRTKTLLGCTYEEFKAHIELLFLPGMSWANFSGCHLDHVVPCAAARTKEDLEALFHYTNLRPLWGADNIRKHAKLPQEYELPDNLHPKVREIWERARRG